MLEEHEGAQPNRMSDRGEELDGEHAVGREPTENSTEPERTGGDTAAGRFSVEFLEAALEPTRLAILCEVDGHAASVGELCGRLSLSATEVEAELRVLIAAGLAVRDEAGSVRSERPGWSELRAQLTAIADTTPAAPEGGQ